MNKNNNNNNNNNLYSIGEDEDNNSDTSNELKRPNTIINNSSNNGSNNNNNCSSSNSSSDGDEKNIIKKENNSGENSPNSIPLDDVCCIKHQKEKEKQKQSSGSSGENSPNIKSKVMKEYQGEEGDDSLENEKQHLDEDVIIDPYGLGSSNINGYKKRRVIRIINKETDYNLEYSFDDFIKFSHDLVEERSGSIKAVPSVSDFSQMIKVSLSSPTIQRSDTNLNIPYSPLPYGNSNNNNNNNNNTISDNNNNSNNNSNGILSTISPTTTPINSNNGNDMSRSRNSFYLNSNSDILNSSSSLLEFSNHLRSTPIRNRKNTNTTPNTATTTNQNIHQSLMDQSNNSNNPVTTATAIPNIEGVGGASVAKEPSKITTSSNSVNFGGVPTFSLSTPRMGGDDGYDTINLGVGGGGGNIKKNEKVYWIDLEALTDEEITEVCNIYSIHHLTCEDIISNDSSEKCEEFSNYTFISTSETIYSSTELVQSNIYMVQFNSFIIVFHQHPLDSSETILNSFRYLDNGVLSSSEWVSSIFFEAFNEIYSELSDQLMKEVKVLDDFTLNEDAAHHQELYVRLGKATRKSTNLLSWIFIKSDILSSLIRLNNRNRENRIHLSNIKDRTIRLKQRIKLAEELLENINNAYISKVSLVLNEESHALNISMRKFSALSVIFMPLNLIAAIFGMNFHLPGNPDDNDQDQNINNFTPFITLLVLMIAIGAILTLFFKRLDWL